MEEEREREGEKGKEKEMEMEMYDEKLPDELKEKVLVRVAVTNLFKLRLVCKGWRELLQSSTFAHAHRREAATDPLLVAAHAHSPHTRLGLYSLSTSHWLRPPLPFLPTRSGGPCIAADFSTCVSDGGLLCCFARAERPPSLLIFNPLTGHFRLLPPPPLGIAEHERRTSTKLRIAFSRNPLTNAYKAAILGANIGHNNGNVRAIVQVYDSKIDYWSIGSSPPMQSIDRRPKFNGYIGQTKEKVYWYNVEEDRWEEAPFPNMDVGLEIHSISIVRIRNEEDQNQDVKGNGKRTRVMLVATLAQCHGPRCNTQGFALWEEVGGPQRSWKEVTRTPTKFISCNVGSYHQTSLRCLANSHLITHPFAMCMTSLTRRYPIASPWDCFYPWLLLYRMSSKSWEWLPRPLGNKTWSNYDALCFLEPSFEALV